MAGAVGQPEMPEAVAGEEMTPEVMSAFDHAAAGRWAEATAQASADHEAAFAKRSADEAHEWAETDKQIAAAEQQATADQQNALTQASGEAASANAAWEIDIAAARSTYQTSRTTTMANLNRDVEARRVQGEKEAAAELEKGENQAKAEKLAKQGEVEAERARVERQSQEFRRLPGLVGRCGVGFV